MSLIVVGTGTEVGKTITCAVLLSRYGRRNPLVYWKPIATGASDGRDTETVGRLCGPIATLLEEKYVFAPPVSPHLAAQRAGRVISPEAILEQFEAHKRAYPDHHFVVEGIGGLLVPLTAKGYLLVDLISALGLPCLLAAQSSLGTINHTLLTLEALRARDLPLIGIVLTGARNPDNRKAIERFGRAKVIAELTPMSPLSRASIARAARTFDRHARLRKYLAAKARS